MKKLATALTALTLVVTGLGAASFAAPASAASIAECSSPGDSYSNWNFDMMAAELRDDGVAYSSIETFANCFLVHVTDADGNTGIALYDASTLHRVQ